MHATSQEEEDKAIKLRTWKIAFIQGGLVYESRLSNGQLNHACIYEGH